MAQAEFFNDLEETRASLPPGTTDLLRQILNNNQAIHDMGDGTSRYEGRVPPPSEPPDPLSEEKSMILDVSV